MNLTGGRTAQRRNRKDAKAVRAAVLKLATTLRGTSLNFRLEFFKDYDPAALGKMNREEIDRAFVHEPLESLRTLSVMLDRLARRAEQLSSPGPKYDAGKRVSAQLAYYVITKLSVNPPTSWSGSPYRAITSLVYESTTGKPGADLERACEAVLKERRDQAR